jgi:hypothetical protein
VTVVEHDGWSGSDDDSELGKQGYWEGGGGQQPSGYRRSWGILNGWGCMGVVRRRLEYMQDWRSHHAGGEGVEQASKAIAIWEDMHMWSWRSRINPKHGRVIAFCCASSWTVAPDKITAVCVSGMVASF